MQNTKIKEKLQELFASYSRNLPGKIARIENQWSDLLTTWDQKRFCDFHREVHTLCGSAGTYGYVALGKSARHLEVYLKSLLTFSALSEQQKNNVTFLLSQLKATLTETGVEKNLLINLPPDENSKSNTVYIFDQDEDFRVEVENHFKESGYNLKKLLNINQLAKVMLEELPSALIIDLEHIDDSDMDMLQEIQKHRTVPLFCTSRKGDILTRLRAIRMNNQVFLQKPVDEFYLTKALDLVCGDSSVDPYRILIIDDSQSMAEYFALILREDGMITRYITNPLTLMEVIEEFQPDVLLMDVYMPECTGLELAAVLRQDAQYTRIPIIFLSTEDDRFKQLSALNIGGDDFLTKPILPQHLIEVVRSRAKRATILSSFMIKDGLTGLLNHTNVLQRLDMELIRAQRESQVLSFVMVDIDHFKKVNDQYGHPIGDEVIRYLATLLSGSLRKSDVVGRYGGEEFAIILPNTDKEQSLRICNDLREKFAQMCHKVNDSGFHVTFSAGISSFPMLKDTKSLIACADQALYAAKENGRNQVAYFEQNPQKNILLSS